MSSTDDKAGESTTRGEKPREVMVERNPGETKDAAIARTALRPTVRAAETWHTFTHDGIRKLVDLPTMISEISNQAKAVISGDMDRPQAMLVAQAHSLDAIFNFLASRAAMNMGEYLDAADTYMRLALRAQSQCRATLETLATIKNPPTAVSFVKQANIAHGPQQVNNGDSAPIRAPAHPRAGKTISSNELLEHQDGERLDPGAANFAGSADQALAAVASVNGTEDRHR